MRGLNHEASETNKEITMNSMMLDLMWTTAGSVSLAVLLVAGVTVLNRG